MLTPELVHLTTMRATLLPDSAMIPGGPLGTRLIAEVDDASFEGERLTGKIFGRAGADWLTLFPDSTWGTLDVRVTIKTDDDALILMTYSGRIDLETQRVVSAPQFECGEPGYAWLNRIQAVAAGRFEDGVLVYDVFEARLPD